MLLFYPFYLITHIFFRCSEISSIHSSLLLGSHSKDWPSSNTILNYDSVNGSRYFKLPLSVILKPLVTNKNIFLLTKSNLLVCLDKKNGKVLWSKKIKNQFLSKNQIKFSKKMGSFIDMTIAQNEIFILTKNGYLITFDYKDGSLNYFDKISKSGFSSRMTFSNGYMYILDNNYRLLKYN